MQEFFPIAAGAAIGALSAQFVAARWRVPVVAALAILVGLVASWASGELAVSWGFASIDTALVLGTALLTMALLGLAQRRTAERRVKAE
jgi:hypothetical protein